jgi:hypothetical protein
MWNVADRDQDDRDGDDAPHDPALRDPAPHDPAPHDPAPHDRGATGDPNAYWRRRFFILGGGVAVLGLCAWLFPGGHPGPPRMSATARASMAALAERGDLPSAAYGSAWPGPTPKKAAKATAAAGASHRKPVVRPHPETSPSPSPSPTATAPSGPRCRPSDIVLSLFTGQPSYGQGALPKFDVYAVSTSSRACIVSYGPGSVQVAVTRHGRVVWDSAACKLSAAPLVRFTSGAPQVLTITWNRRASQPSGCAGSLPADSWGTFNAVALTDGQSSPVRSFKLSR